jgi:hypothetical protein
MWAELREMSFEEPPETPSMVIEEVNEDNLEDSEANTQGKKGQRSRAIPVSRKAGRSRFTPQVAPRVTPKPRTAIKMKSLDEVIRSCSSESVGINRSAVGFR